MTLVSLFKVVKKYATLSILGITCFPVTAQQSNTYIDIPTIDSIVNDSPTFSTSTAINIQYSNSAIENLQNNSTLRSIANELLMHSEIPLSEPNDYWQEHSALINLFNACGHLFSLSPNTCAAKADTSSQHNVKTTKVYITNMHGQLPSTSWFGDDIRWGFKSSVELAEKAIPFEDANNWAHAGASIELNTRLEPEFRVGYTQSLAGSDFGYYSVGITFFKQAELNAGWIEQNSKVENNHSSRSAYFSFAIQTKF